MGDPSVLAPQNSRFVQAMAPPQDDVLEDIEALNRERAFPMVGPEVGGFLAMVARMVDANRIFEFGSGLGYSGYWFARALPTDGKIVLTEEDADELETAREFFERGGLADRAAFEAGDAHDTFAQYDGPFDVVLVDHEKERYAEAFAAIKPKLAPGGIVIADNAMMAADAIDLDGIIAALEGDDPALDSMTAGIVEYLQTVRADPEFDTVGVPLGEGLALSLKR